MSKALRRIRPEAFVVIGVIVGILVFIGINALAVGFAPRQGKATDVSQAGERRSLRFEERASQELLWTFSNGVDRLDLSSATAAVFYYNYGTEWIKAVTGTIHNATGGQVLVSFAPSDLQTNTYSTGALQYRLEVTSSSQTLARAYGLLSIIKDWSYYATTSFPTGAPLDWADFDSYANTEASGPVRPSADFGVTENGDGSITLDLDNITNQLTQAINTNGSQAASIAENTANITAVSNLVGGACDTNAIYWLGQTNDAQWTSIANNASTGAVNAANITAVSNLVGGACDTNAIYWLGQTNDNQWTSIANNASTGAANTAILNGRDFAYTGSNQTFAGINTFSGTSNIFTTPLVITDDIDLGAGGFGGGQIIGRGGELILDYRGLLNLNTEIEYTSTAVETGLVDLINFVTKTFSGEWYFDNNVGFGVTNPTNALDVAGVAKISQSGEGTALNTGALRVLIGGASIEGDVYFGDDLILADDADIGGDLKVNSAATGWTQGPFTSGILQLGGRKINDNGLLHNAGITVYRSKLNNGHKLLNVGSFMDDNRTGTNMMYLAGTKASGTTGEGKSFGYSTHALTNGANIYGFYGRQRAVDTGLQSNIVFYARPTGTGSNYAMYAEQGLIRTLASTTNQFQGVTEVITPTAGTTQAATAEYAENHANHTNVLNAYPVTFPYPTNNLPILAARILYDATITSTEVNAIGATGTFDIAVGTGGTHPVNATLRATNVPLQTTGSMVTNTYSLDVNAGDCVWYIIDDLSGFNTTNIAWSVILTER